MLLDYESDAIAAERAGDKIDVIVPKQTILIETPIAVMQKSSHVAQAKAFVNWLLTPTRHEAVGRSRGYRPGQPFLPSVGGNGSSQQHVPEEDRSCSRLASLGGWTKVVTIEFFNPPDAAR